MRQKASEIRLTDVVQTREADSGDIAGLTGRRILEEVVVDRPCEDLLVGEPFETQTRDKADLAQKELLTGELAAAAQFRLNRSRHVEAPFRFSTDFPSTVTHKFENLLRNKFAFSQFNRRFLQESGMGFVCCATYFSL